MASRQERLDRLLKLAGLAYVEVGADGNVESAGGALDGLLGSQAERLVGRPAPFDAPENVGPEWTGSVTCPPEGSPTRPVTAWKVSDGQTSAWMLRQPLGRAETKAEGGERGGRERESGSNQAGDRYAVGKALLGSLGARDPQSAGHSWRVWMILEAVAEELGLLNPSNQSSLKMGALLHDVGKVGIADTVLLKTGALTDDDRRVMRMHPVIGYDLLRNVTDDDLVLRMVRHHHERCDGSGYPDGLTTSALPAEVRALSICDMFDALTSVRPYRPALPPRRVLEILTEEADMGRLDLRAVEALRKVVTAGGLFHLLGKDSAAA